MYYEISASEAFAEEALTNGAIIGYSEVTETQYNSQSSLNGFIKYRYSNFDTFPDLFPERLYAMISVCFVSYTNRSMDRGLLLSKEIYNKNFTLNKKFEYLYTNDHLNNIKAVDIKNSSFAGMPALSVISAYYVPLDSPNLIQEAETTYEGNASSGLKKVTKYLYNDRKQVKEIRTQMNDGQTWHYKRFQYPTDYPGDAVYNNMIEKNMISPIIQNEEFMIGSKNDVSYISKEKYNYVQIADKDGTMTPVISNYQSSKGTDNVETHVTYDYYDKKGNPLLVTIDDKERIIYLWGYNYQYIVAEIKNASMEEVNAVIGDIDKFEKADTPDTSKLYELRMELKNAFIRTFTFEPLIGKIKETDAKGVSTYFEYNQQNRLKYTRDYLGDIMEGYLYNYSNTNQQ